MTSSLRVSFPLTDGTHAPSGFPAIPPARQKSQVTVGFVQPLATNQPATLPRRSPSAGGVPNSSPVELIPGSVSPGTLSGDVR